MTSPTRAISTAAALALLSLAGCGTSAESRFYMLSPIDDPAPAKPPALPAGTAVRVHVKIAEYLNRQEIVTRVSANQYKLADYDRWAEPLQVNLPRVLADNLARLLGTDRVTVTDWTGDEAEGLGLAVQVARLDITPDKDVTLDIRWRILAGPGGKEVRGGKSVITEPTQGPGFDAVAAAASRALGAASKELATALAQAAGKP